MEALIRKFTDKLVAAGFAEPGAPLMGAIDDEILWNREDPMRPLLAEVFGMLSIESLLFSIPAEPYRTAVAYLAERADGAIFPTDTETRTFLHDLPVAASLSAEEICDALKERKCVIVPGSGVVTFGTVSLEQAFITFCSVCFACFVKFFADYLGDIRQGRVTQAQAAAFGRAVTHLAPPAPASPSLLKGPFCTPELVLEAMEEVGRATVRHRLVDSYFGNLSFLMGKQLFISQTGSSLDELAGCIDAVPLDGSSCAGITASSELSAHRQIVLYTGRQAVLHGHPPFAVILSLDCDRADCPERGFCHIRCPEQRFAAKVPVVPGEVGTGRYGLCRTVPPILQDRTGVIVHGHGVFTAGSGDFNGAFSELFAIENACRNEYFRRVSP
jgi:ribulose-5-phosphate 4-epimerase/fuculose-1-phosphate aldolase